MTDHHRALSRELLADLDADLLEPARAAEVRAAADRDSHARADLAALAATRAELGALADPPVPDRYPTRWDAALAAEAEAAARAASDTAVRRPQARRRRLALGGSVALAAAAVTVTGILWAPRPSTLPSLDGVNLVSAGLTAMGTTDVGELADPERRAACLRVVAPPGVVAGAELLGGRQVTLAGRPAVLLVLAAGGPRPGVDIVVVDAACGPDGGTLLGQQSTGG
jgi:hypothetical protein